MANLETIPINKIENLAPHWFSNGNKRFFKSRWDNYALHNEKSTYAYFISSEKHTYYSYDVNINEPRKYTIKKINLKNGNFKEDKNTDIFEFQHFNTKKQAETALRKYLKNEPIKQDYIEYLKREITATEYEIQRQNAHLNAIKEDLQKVLAE